LDFSSIGEGTAFAKLTPDIGQIFFIGDGLSGTKTGNSQTFDVPPSATRLYLGLADSGDPRKETAPGYYSDNTGAFTITVHLSSERVNFSRPPNPHRLLPGEAVMLQGGTKAQISGNRLLIKRGDGKTIRARGGRYLTKDGRVIVVEKDGVIAK
jgi:hypothetical protein